MPPLKVLLSKFIKGDTSNPNIPQPATHPPSSLIKPTPRSKMSEHPPRFLIIGAGSRGRNYARTIIESSNGVVAAVTEPVKSKREFLGRFYIWVTTVPERASPLMIGSSSSTTSRTAGGGRRAAAGDQGVLDGVDGTFICVLDEMHREVVIGFSPLGLHIMCEKPLACSLQDCLDMYKALRP